MNSTSGGLINLAIVWGIASAAGFVAMAGLMILGDWTLLQALFAGGPSSFLRARVASVLAVPQAAARPDSGRRSGDTGRKTRRRTRGRRGACACTSSSPGSTGARACTSPLNRLQPRPRQRPRSRQAKASGPPRWTGRAKGGGR